MHPLTQNIQPNGGLVDPLLIRALDRVNSGMIPRHVHDLQRVVVEPAVARIPLSFI